MFVFTTLPTIFSLSFRISEVRNVAVSDTTGDPKRTNAGNKSLIKGFKKYWHYISAYIYRISTYIYD